MTTVSPGWRVAERLRLSRLRASTVVPYCCAMLNRVSPERTVCKRCPPEDRASEDRASSAAPGFDFVDFFDDARSSGAGLPALIMISATLRRAHRT